VAAAAACEKKNHNILLRVCFSATREKTCVHHLEAKQEPSDSLRYRSENKAMQSTWRYPTASFKTSQSTHQQLTRMTNALQRVKECFLSFGAIFPSSPHRVWRASSPSSWW
jgi:hypothetical protein